MFCRWCGSAVIPGAPFCPGCGAVQDDAGPAQPVMGQTGVSAVPAPVRPASESSHLEGEVQSTLQRLARSPLFLITAILFTLSVLLSLIEGTSSLDGLGSIMSQAGLSSEFRSLQDMVYFVSILASIPGILVTAGLWITYASGFSRRGRLSGAGLTMIMVVQIINVVFIGLIVGIYSIVLLVALSQTGQNDQDTAATVTAISAVVIGFVVFYCICLLKTVHRMHNAATRSDPDPRASCFLAVMCILSGVLTLLGELFVGVIGMSDLGLLLGGFSLGSLADAGAMILFGVLIFVYRHMMYPHWREQYAYR